MSDFQNLKKLRSKVDFVESQWKFLQSSNKLSYESVISLSEIEHSVAVMVLKALYEDTSDYNNEDSVMSISKVQPFFHLKQIPIIKEVLFDE